jgi:Flp pilus assembly protein TadG
MRSLDNPSLARTHASARNPAPCSGAATDIAQPHLVRRWALRSRLGAALRDRRGATAVVFALAGTAVIGMVGLGTEGGTWYLTRRDAQNAADTAAYAGAVRLTSSQTALALTLASARTQAIAAATDTATQNSFTTGTSSTTVTVNTPPVAPSAYAGNSTAVQVIIQRTRPRLLSGLFLSTDPVIIASGVASVLSQGPACMLAGVPSGGSGLSIGGSASVNAGSCILGSNSTASNGINIFGSATVSAGSLNSAGGCSGCASATLATPYTAYGPPTTNPFAYLDTKLATTPMPSTCYTVAGLNNGNGSISVNPLALSPQANKSICAFHASGNGQVIHFTPGTYYFYNTNFTIDGGVTVDCLLCVGGKGVTLVFSGSPASKIGGPVIAANANVTLTAPSKNFGDNPATATLYDDRAYDGILFFRDPNATSNSGNAQVSISGGANTVLTGGMYFPNSNITYQGNSTTSQCSVVVAGGITLTGNTGVNVSNCGGLLGLPGLAPQLQIVRLVE